MHGVRPGVAGPGRHLLGVDRPDQCRLPRIGLRIEDVDVRRPQARRDEVPAFDVRMGRIRAEARAAGVPSEVMQLVARARHGHPADDLRIGRRLRVDVDHRQPVRALALGIELGHVGVPLGRGLRRQARGGIECRVGCPGRHVGVPLGVARFARGEHEGHCHGARHMKWHRAEVENRTRPPAVVKEDGVVTKPYAVRTWGLWTLIGLPAAKASTWSKMMLNWCSRPSRST